MRQVAEDDAVVDDVVSSGGSERISSRLWANRPRWADALLGFAAGALVVGLVAAGLQREASRASAGVSLSCNDPLPERRLNISLSWGSAADDVTLDLGDGQRKKLRPEYSDESALSEAIQHQYTAPGRYEVVLAAREESATASAACTFTATD